MDQWVNNVYISYTYPLSISVYMDVDKYTIEREGNFFNFELNLHYIVSWGNESVLACYI
jgi:hypothetical protein